MASGSEAWMAKTSWSRVEPSSQRTTGGGETNDTDPPRSLAALRATISAPNPVESTKVTSAKSMTTWRDRLAEQVCDVVAPGECLECGHINDASELEPPTTELARLYAEGILDLSAPLVGECLAIHQDER
jgi:hypothetical protein